MNREELLNETKKKYNPEKIKLRRKAWQRTQSNKQPLMNRVPVHQPKYKIHTMINFDCNVLNKHLADEFYLRIELRINSSKDISKNEKMCVYE